MTEEDARRIALSMPGATEGAHHGHPDFRVGKSIFATLWPAKNRSVLRLPLPVAESLEKESPEIYRLVSRARAGWLSVELEQADPEEFQRLMELAREFLTSGKKA